MYAIMGFDFWILDYSSSTHTGTDTDEKSGLMIRYANRSKADAKTHSWKFMF